MSQAIANKSQVPKQLVYKLIVIVLMFGFGLLPAIGEMTPLGMKIFGIFIGAIIGWITIDLIWPSLLGIIALGLSGAYESMSDCFAAVFGSQTALMLFGSIFACAVIEKTDLSKVIVGALMNLKIAKKSSFIMSFFFFLSAFIVATLSHSIVASMLIISLYRTVTKECNVPPQHYTNSYYLVGIALSACFGDLTFPFKPTAFAILSTYQAFTGHEISFLKYLIFFTTALIMLMILYVVVGRFIIRVDMSFFKNSTLVVEKVNANKKQKTCLIFLILMMMALMVPSVFPNTSLPVLSVFNYLGLGGISVGTLVVMMFWQTDGEPLMNLQELSALFNWGIYLCISFFIPLGSFVGGDNTGISATLSLLFQPILSGLPPMVFLVVIVILAIILTNFLNNMVVSMLFISIMFSLQEYLPGVNMEAATLAIVLGAYAACATPAANPCNAYIFSNTDLISFKNQMSQGVKACIMIAVFTLVIYYPFVNILY